MQLDILKMLNEERAARRGVLLATNLRTGAQELVLESNLDSSAPLAESYRKAFRQGKSVTVENEGDEVFLNVFVPPPRMILIGAVHITQALYPMAAAAGFDVTIIDPRTAFATPERFPDVPLHAEWPDSVLPGLAVDRYTAVATLTHDPKIDDPALIHALGKDCFYIGALGSKRTHAKRVERLTAAGFTERDIARIHAPIGLDLGAVSPAEIAVSVLAQIIRSLRQEGEEAK
jgi:xanthine dehydrogenase accessory factor